MLAGSDRRRVVGVGAVHAQAEQQRGGQRRHRARVGLRQRGDRAGRGAASAVDVWLWGGAAAYREEQCCGGGWPGQHALQHSGHPLGYEVHSRAQSTRVPGSAGPRDGEPVLRGLGQMDQRLDHLVVQVCRACRGQEVGQAPAGIGHQGPAQDGRGRLKHRRGVLGAVAGQVPKRRQESDDCVLPHEIQGQGDHRIGEQGGAALREDGKASAGSRRALVALRSRIGVEDSDVVQCARHDRVGGHPHGTPALGPPCPVRVQLLRALVVGRPRSGRLGLLLLHERGQVRYVPGGLTQLAAHAVRVVELPHDQCQVHGRAAVSDRAADPPHVDRQTGGLLCITLPAELDELHPQAVTPSHLDYVGVAPPGTHRAVEQLVRV